MLLCVHTRYNLFAHSSCTSLFILIFIKSTVDCIAHFISLHILLLILFYFIFYLFFILFLPIFIYTLLCYVSSFILFFCTVHWADPSWPTFHYWLYPVWLCMWQINKNPWTPWTFSFYFFFFVINILIFFTHNTTQHSKYNKTKQQTHTQHLKVQSKGRERGKDNKNTKVTPLSFLLLLFCWGLCFCIALINNIFIYFLGFSHFSHSNSK